MGNWGLLFTTASFAYFLGSLPFSYWLAKAVSGKEITKIGTGNIGAMNVRRATDSWVWFSTAMILDGVKGFLSVIFGQTMAIQYGADINLLAATGLILSVLGHSYSLTAYLITGKLKSGRGLATGGGALLAYNWTYLFVSIMFALIVIFLTKYLLAGQITVPLFLVIFVYLKNPEDLPYILPVAVIIILRHLPRVPGLFKGKEPKWNVKDYHQVDKNHNP